MTKYFYKEKPYMLLYESKIKLNGVWQDVIVYKCMYENPDGMIWTRLKDDFFKLFEEK